MVDFILLFTIFLILGCLLGYFYIDINGKDNK